MTTSNSYRQDRLKWLECPRCGCELDFLIPVDTADSNVNVVKMQDILNDHLEVCTPPL